MNSLSKQNKGLSKSFFLFLSVVIILINSGYYRSTTTDSYVPLILLIAFAGMCFLTTRINFLDMKVFSVPAILMFAILFSTIFNFNMGNMLSGIRVLATMLCAYMLTCYLPFHTFSRIFTKAIKVLIIISLLFSFARMLGFGSFPMVNGYVDLFIVTEKFAGGRAHGIFWEPGVFASMIIISMLCEYFIDDNRVTPLGFIIYLSGLLATRSTAGLVILLLVIFGLLWTKLSNKQKNPLYTALFIIAVLCIVIFYDAIVNALVNVSPELFGKLVETESGTTSTRINAPLINFGVFTEKPLFGWGFTDSSSEILSRMPMKGDAKVLGQTSTSTQIMAAIGFLGAFYSLGFILPIFSNKKLPHLGIEIKTIIAACFLFIVNKEPHLFIVTTWMILFYINSTTNHFEYKNNLEE